MSKIRKNLFVAFLIFLSLILPLTTAFALVEGKTILSANELSKHGAIRLSQNWKYHPGNNPDWADPGFDDRSWEMTNTQFPPHQLPAGWDGVGWFRLHLVVDSTLWNKALALSIWQWGASEIYLDGSLLAQYGKIGSSKNDEEGYATLTAELSPPKSIFFDQDRDHVIAVRYSNFFLLQKAPNIWHGFQIILRDLNTAVASNAARRRIDAIILVMTTVVPIVFAVLHLLLFLFYRRAKENLYFAIMTLTIGAAAFFWYQYRFSFVTDLRQAFLFNNLGQILVLLMALSGLRFLYAIFKKKNGAWIIGTGFILMVITFGSPVVLMGIGILPWNLTFTVVVPSLGVFGLLLSMSVFLARNFAQTHKALQAQSTELAFQVGEKTRTAEALQNALSEVEQLKDRLQAENVYLQDEIKLQHNFGKITCSSEVMKSLLRKVEQVAAGDTTVLILGETAPARSS